MMEEQEEQEQEEVDDDAEEALVAEVLRLSLREAEASEAARRAAFAAERQAAYEAALQRDRERDIERVRRRRAQVLAAEEDSEDSEDSEEEAFVVEKEDAGATTVVVTMPEEPAVGGRELGFRAWDGRRARHRFADGARVQALYDYAALVFGGGTAAGLVLTSDYPRTAYAALPRTATLAECAVPPRTLIHVHRRL